MFPTKHSGHVKLAGKILRRHNGTALHSVAVLVIFVPPSSPTKTVPRAAVLITPFSYTTEILLYALPSTTETEPVIIYSSNWFEANQKLHLGNS